MDVNINYNFIMFNGPGKQHSAGKAEPRITMLGVAKILGVHKATVYRRISSGKFSLQGIPSQETSLGVFYDLAAVLRKVYPGADDNTLTLMMFQFRQEHGRYIQ